MCIQTKHNFTASISNIAEGIGSQNRIKEIVRLCSDVLLRACPKNDKQLLGQLLYYRLRISVSLHPID